MEDFINKYAVKKFLSAFWAYRFYILFIIFFITTGVAIYALSRPNTYASVATIMNVDSSRGFSGSGNMLQIFGLGKERNEGFMNFAAIIGSRTFKEKMVVSLGPELFAPQKGWHGTKEELYNHAVGVLGSSIRLDIDPRKSNILNIVVEMQDDRLPPIIANHILIVLQKYISDNAFTKAAMIRRYVQNSIVETKAAIFETANSISNFYQTFDIDPKNSMVKLPLQRDIAALNIKMDEDAFSDPAIKNTFKALNERKKNLKERLEMIKEIPGQSYFDYLNEEYAILKEINLALRNQYEIAKLEEIKQEPAFQILDKALPAHRSGPRRAFITFAGFAFSLMLALFYVLTKTFFPVRRTQKLQNVENARTGLTDSLLHKI